MHSGCVTDAQRAHSAEGPMPKMKEQLECRQSGGPGLALLLSAPTEAPRKKARAAPTPAMLTLQRQEHSRR
jgi:hypothetical protein